MTYRYRYSSTGMAWHHGMHAWEYYHAMECFRVLRTATTVMAVFELVLALAMEITKGIARFAGFVVHRCSPGVRCDAFEWHECSYLYVPTHLQFGQNFE